MSYLVSARKYRPQTFDEVFEQHHITTILKNAIESERVAHSYLFTGSRGVGKTSLARILAKSLNCLEGPSSIPCNKCHNCVEITQCHSNDVVEIDGASNTGVEDIRDLQKELMYLTSQSKYKIYIIDEVHMLSKNAFNALLKTLEEPPENVIFIFATTEPHKVLPTIISRCQRFDFKRISIDSIIRKIKEICVNEKAQIEEEGLYIIARKADGSMRDALSLLDQVFSISQEKVTTEQILELFGEVHLDVFFNVMKCVIEKKPTEIIKIIHSLIDKGNDLQEFINGLLDYVRNILLLNLNIKVQDIPPNHINLVKEIAKNFNENELLYILSFLVKAKADIKSASNPILIAEILFVKLSKIGDIKVIEDIISDLKNLGPEDSSPTFSLSKIKPQVKDDTILEEAESEIDNGDLEEESFTDEITLSNIRNAWDVLVNKVKYLLKGFSHVYFGNCSAESLEKKNSKFILTIKCKSSTEHKYLKEKNDLINEIFKDYFNSDFEVDIQLSEEKYQQKKNITLSDIKEKSPELGEFIEKHGSNFIIERNFS